MDIVFLGIYMVKLFTRILFPPCQGLSRKGILLYNSNEGRPRKVFLTKNASFHHRVWSISRAINPPIEVYPFMKLSGWLLY